MGGALRSTPAAGAQVRVAQVTSCTSPCPTCLCLRLFRVVPPTGVVPSLMLNDFITFWHRELWPFFKLPGLIGNGLFAAPCAPGCNHEPRLFCKGECVSLSPIPGTDKPGTAEDAPS